MGEPIEVIIKKEAPKGMGLFGFAILVGVVLLLVGIMALFMDLYPLFGESVGISKEAIVSLSIGILLLVSCFLLWWRSR